MAKLQVLEQLAAWKERYPAPCQAACPVHTGARDYVSLISQGRFEEAFIVARGPNPFASVCGRACSAPCEDVCTRGELDRPIRIRQLKRFLTDRYAASRPAIPPATHTGLRVAVVGAGPAGLAAAHDLALLGHEVTVFEASEAAGGTALLGVPRFRLASDAIERDVAAITALGVEIRTGVRVGADITLAAIQDDYHAVFIAAGAMRPNGLDIPGGDLGGVIQALPFLEEANLGGRPAVGKRVAVIGGGYTAMDAARTAIRLGAEAVTVLYRRTRNETEVHDEELEETLQEGVLIQYLVSPLRAVDDGAGHIAGLEFIRNRLGEPDASGRARPVPITGSEFVYECDTVLLAIGQAPDPGTLDPDRGAALRHVDESTLMTAVPGVFAGGDFVTGPTTIIEAVAHGRAAAESIHHYLERRQSYPPHWAAPLEKVDYVPVARENGTRTNGTHAWTALPRRHDIPLGLENEVEVTFTPEEAEMEGLRCLLCGLLPYIELSGCTACQACVVVCPVDAIDRVAIAHHGGADELTGERDVLGYAINEDACIKCGRCFGECPTGTIKVYGMP